MRVGGKILPTPISKKMFVALSTLRNSEDEGLWIDQLCINQDDKDEKHVAVASMDVLYRSARLVLIVLEDIVFTARDLEIWDRCTDEWERDEYWNPSGEDDASMAALLVKIFSARWFSRVWCIHEHHVGANSRIIINFETGQNSIATSLDQLLDYLQRTMQACKDPVWSRRLWSLNNEVDGRLFRWRIPTSRLEAATTYGLSLSAPPLMQLISMIFTLDASVTSDKLSVALNISGLNVFFKDTPTTADECCAIFSMVALAAGDATVLCTRGGRLQLGGGRKRLSWMQWPESHSKIQASNVTLQSLPPNFIVSFNELTLDLYILLDRQRSPTESSLQRATLLHDLLVRNGVFDVRDSDQLQDYTRAVAAAFDCGLDWMAQAWDILSSTDGAIDKFALASLEESATPFSELESSITSILTEGVPELPHTSALTNAKSRRSVLRFLYTLYACDEVAGASIATGPDVQQHRGLQVPLPLTPGTDAILAVPVILSGPEYSIYNRLWVLERVELEDGQENEHRDEVNGKSVANEADYVGSCYRITGKSSLFGCQKLHHDGQVIALRKNQHIVG